MMSLPPCALVAPKLCEGASSRRLSAHALNHPAIVFGLTTKFRGASLYHFLKRHLHKFARCKNDGLCLGCC